MALRRRHYVEHRHRTIHHHRHHHRVLGGERVRHHHTRTGVHHRLNSWQRFVKTHMRPGLTLRHLATMYHSHMGHVGRPRTRTHRIYHRRAMSY